LSPSTSFPSRPSLAGVAGAAGAGDVDPSRKLPGNPSWAG